MSTPTTKPIYLYSTLSRSKDLFTPLNPERVGIYACGPTVYKDIHLGNFRTFIMTDWVRRMLEYNGYNVFLVSNITDVGHLQNDTDETGEDKLEHEARLTGRNAYDIAAYYTEQYLRDSSTLNIQPPHLRPKATEHIPEMQAMTEALIKYGLAYTTTDGNVYYDVSKFSSYGELSGNTIENLRAGGHGRQQMEVAEDKHAPEDFALWKRGSEDRQMNWDSPWGTGFPGWHIECSAMATKYLGEQFDIHTGGIDLRFPHHEDEIAQSQGVSGKQPVQVWMHGEHLVLGGSVKMSRSTGTGLLLSNLEAQGIDPMAYRYLLLTAHYRSKLNFTDDSIIAAQNGLNNLRADIASLPAVTASSTQQGWSTEAQQVHDAFQQAINDDLDLPTALSLTREVARNNKIAPEERHRLILDFDRVLGLRLDTVEAKKTYIMAGIDQLKPEDTGQIEIQTQHVDQIIATDMGSLQSIPGDAILALVRQRDEARVLRNWKRSDEIRDQLKALGFEVRDTPRGTELEQKQ